jgi:hypothetical protein
MIKILAGKTTNRRVLRPNQVKKSLTAFRKRKTRKKASKKILPKLPKEKTRINIFGCIDSHKFFWSFQKVGS